jgi:integrase
MAVYKRKYRSGKTVWCFTIDAPGSTRENRRQIMESGFPTKGAAENAEAERRITEQKRYQLENAGLPDVPLPKTLAELLKDFFSEYAERKLARKTIERYREQVAYLHPDLLAMRIPLITPLHLSKEWTRLLESGGHYRRSKAPRALSAKTVRNVAGVVSSAFARAIRWGLVTSNPVAQSEAPVPRRHSGIALTPSQQKLLIEAATGCWCLPAFLELSAATGARRGELLALRWSDIQDGAVLIARSLSQTRAGLAFKDTKNRRTRTIVLPDSAVAALIAHRRSSGCIPRAVRIGLQSRCGFDFRGAGWHAAEAGLYILLGVRAVQAAQNAEAEGCQPAPVAALARIAPVGIWHGTSGGLGTLGSQFGSGNRHRLLTLHHWAG